jgi:hypothetical protein
VVGVDADLVTAGVVDMVTFGDGADVVLIGCAVSIHVLATYVQRSSTFLVDVTSPHPAAVFVFLDPLEEPTEVELFH